VVLDSHLGCHLPLGLVPVCYLLVPAVAQLVLPLAAALGASCPSVRLLRLLVAPYPENYPVIMILREILLYSWVNQFTLKKFSR